MSPADLWIEAQKALSARNYAAMRDLADKASMAETMHGTDGVLLRAIFGGEAPAPVAAPTPAAIAAKKAVLAEIRRHKDALAQAKASQPGPSAKKLPADASDLRKLVLQSVQNGINTRRAIEEAHGELAARAAMAMVREKFLIENRKGILSV